MKDSPELCDGAVLKPVRFVKEVRDLPTGIHHEVCSRPYNYKPPKNGKKEIRWRSDANSSYAKEQFKDAERDTNREREKKRATEKMLDTIGFALTPVLFGFIGIRIHDIGIGFYMNTAFAVFMPVSLHCQQLIGG